MGKNIIRSTLTVIFSALFVGQTLFADVWPGYHNTQQRTGATTNYGPDCCSTACDVNIQFSLASPVIDGANQKVYMQGASSPSGPWNLWCVDANDCSIKWTYLLSDSMPTNGLIIHSSCAIYGDSLIYVGSPVDSSFYCIDSSGAYKWKYKTDGRIRPSPAVSSDGSVIYTMCDDGYLYAINSDSTLKWKTLTTSSSSKYSSPTLSPDDSTIYVGSYNNKLYAIKADSGSIRWSFVTGDEVRTTPAIGIYTDTATLITDTIIYVTSYTGRIYAIRQDGSLKWSRVLGGNANSSPALDVGRGIVYVGSDSTTNNRLNALNMSDGTIKWRKTLAGGPRYSSPAIALPNNLIYIGDASNTINVIANWVDSGVIVCQKTYDWPITSPVIGADTSVWFNGYSYLHKIKCWATQFPIEENKINLKINSIRNWPNPFSKETKIFLTLPEKSFVNLDIYDITGKLVKTLSGNYAEGQHSIKWDAKDNRGNKIKTGIYLCRLKTNSYSITRKITVIE
ncbi:MAG: PQQ-binding-like beta-propeller repeat protein [bacterium]|nr:PQQ-binding-like beta-propeller repeat protein [bacterium]